VARVLCPCPVRAEARDEPEAKVLAGFAVRRAEGHHALDELEEVQLLAHGPAHDLEDAVAPGRGELEAPIAVAVADVDGDGDLDVVASAIMDDVVAWYENDGAQSFAKHVVAASAEKVYAVAAADVDGDGATDFVTVDEDADVVTLYANTGYHTSRSDLSLTQRAWLP